MSEFTPEEEKLLEAIGTIDIAEQLLKETDRAIIRLFGEKMQNLIEEKGLDKKELANEIIGSGGNIGRYGYK